MTLPAHLVAEALAQVCPEGWRVVSEAELVKAQNDTPFTEAEAADFLRVSVPLLRKWRTNGSGPKFFKAGRHPLYQRSDLLEWVGESPKIRSTAEIKKVS